MSKLYATYKVIIKNRCAKTLEKKQLALAD